VVKEKDTYFRCGKGTKRSVYYCIRCWDKPEETKIAMWRSRVSK
jgi:hypothetical protein